MKIIFGKTTHKRFISKKHSFTYPLYLLEVDICDLNKLSSSNKLFGYNKGFISINDNDYLGDERKSISEKINNEIKSLACYEKINRIKMISIPRFGKKTFRPVGFYICYDKDNNCIAYIAEVSNTYHERHLYKMENNKESLTQSKVFHVSPFFEEKGEYIFKWKDTKTRFECHIDYQINNETVFYANFLGNKHTLTYSNVIKLLLLYPLTATLVFPRIIYQAGILHFKHRVSSFTKPNPLGKNTIRKMPTSKFHKKILNRIENSCKNISLGGLVLRLPDQMEYKFGNINSSLLAKVNIHHNWFFKYIVKNGEIGFGESYVEGHWDTDDLSNVLQFMVINNDQIESEFNGNLILRSFNKLRHKFKRNTQRKSKKHICSL